MHLQRLEPYAPKGACTVLRGLGAGNRVWLPDQYALDGPGLAPIWGACAILLAS